MDSHQPIAKLITDVWEKKDFELLLNHLSDRVEWLEGSYSEPLKGTEAVLNQWKTDLSTQTSIKVATKVMGANGREGYYHCRASWIEGLKVPREMDGVLVVRLDGQGKISYLNSWWTEKPSVK